MADKEESPEVRIRLTPEAMRAIKERSEELRTRFWNKRRDRIIFDMRSLPLPVVHQDFTFAPSALYAPRDSEPRTPEQLKATVIDGWMKNLIVIMASQYGGITEEELGVAADYYDDAGDVESSAILRFLARQLKIRNHEQTYNCKECD